MKILIVDDSKLIRESITAELARGGFSVLTAENGDQAIDLYNADPEISLITLDVNMEGFDGFETLRRIRQIESENAAGKTPVVFVTGNDNFEDRIRGFELGAQDFIVKPFVHGQILEVVQRLLSPSEELKGTRILIVDDNDVARFIIARALREVGAETLEAACGNDALSTLRTNTLDMVVTDLVMPDMNGDILCRMVREQLGMKDIPLIILSAFNERARMLEFFRAGATDYLLKPFIKEELVARLFIHLERSRMLKLLHSTLIEKENLISKSNYLIDKLKDANTRLIRLQQELVDMERRNTVLAMAVTANHEINQPLMVIKGNLELLQSQISTTEREDKYLTRIHESIERIETILTKLRSLAEDDSPLVDYSARNKMYDLNAKPDEK